MIILCEIRALYLARLPEQVVHQSDFEIVGTGTQKHITQVLPHHLNYITKKPPESGLLLGVVVPQRLKCLL